MHTTFILCDDDEGHVNLITRNFKRNGISNPILHFKDGQAAFDYASKFTRQKFSESVVNGIIHDGQSIGLMETFGTNPKAMFDRILKDAQEINKTNFKAKDTIKIKSK